MRGDASEARTSSVMSTGGSIARADGSMHAADPPRAAQCPRRVVRGPSLLLARAESLVNGRQNASSSPTPSGEDGGTPRARATSAAGAMALLARAPDGTIGLTSLGAEVRASSPSTPPSPRRRREISSRSRPN